MNTPESYLASLRRKLKSQLRHNRIEFRPEGVFVYCAYCDKPIKDNSLDMNECLITRGDVAGNEILMQMIMVPENCVLVHHGDCHKWAHTVEGQERCTENLIKWNGVDSIQGWLYQMRNAMRSSIPTEALHRVEEIGANYELRRLRQKN